MSKSQRFAKLVELGCVVCKRTYGAYTEPEIHHLRSRGSAGKKALWEFTIPLCPMHHRLGGYGTAFHAGKMAFQKLYGTEEDLLAYTNENL